MSERRSTAGELPDEVVPEGQEDNPNPPDEIAANRARFEARRRELQADRQQTTAAVEPVQSHVEEQYRRSMANPAHQAFIPEQIAHSEHEPVHQPGGQAHDRDPFEMGRAPLNPETNSPTAAPLVDPVGQDDAPAMNEP